MTNIKNIGKELLGKSLNSYHRRTGLTQLEKNNEMQDGILNGILSQVDNAYIEKTEQSNVMHLDGSGDGVVLVDSIEGNTIVNLVKQGDKENVIGISGGTSAKYQYTQNLKNNTDYVAIMYFENITNEDFLNLNISYNRGLYGNQHIVNSNGTFVFKFNTQARDWLDAFWIYFTSGTVVTSTNPKVKNLMVFETSSIENIPIQYFEGLQSSFEEKITDEGKYEIEILMKGSNQFDYTKKPSSVSPNSGGYANYDDQLIYFDKSKDYWFEYEKSTQNNIMTYFQCYDINKKPIYINYNTNTYNKSIVNYSNTKVFHRNTAYVSLKFRDTSATTEEYLKNMITKCHFGIDTPNDRNIKEPKQNKIKLLINEPLRAIDDIKDKLCVKDSKLVVERNLMEVVLDDKKTYGGYSSNHIDTDPIVPFSYLLDTPLVNGIQKVMCNQLPYNGNAVHARNVVGIASFREDAHNHNALRFGIHKNTLGITDALEKISYRLQLINYLKDNPLKVIVKRAEPVYEEVLNECGEPIILEGYENGTLYIDSTIVPTTSVRYTPKMESFKAIKEVKSNNSLLSNDINESIIPYMMEVDMLIMEKEMSLFSSLNKNIRKMEVLDMTSMQKRTYDMLARLIKGKTLNEQECKTRVTVYLNAGKITDEQAKELNFLIDEIYA